MFPNISATLAFLLTLSLNFTKKIFVSLQGMKTKHGRQKPYGTNVYVFLLEYLNDKEHPDG